MIKKTSRIYGTEERKRLYKVLKPEFDNLKSLALKLYDFDDEQVNNFVVVNLDLAEIKSWFVSAGIIANYIELILFKKGNFGVEFSSEIKSLNGAPIAKKCLPKLEGISKWY